MLLRHLRRHQPTTFRHPQPTVLRPLVRSLSTSPFDWQPSKTRHLNDFDSHDQLHHNDAHPPATNTSQPQQQQGHEQPQQQQPAVKYGRMRPRMSQRRQPVHMVTRRQTAAARPRLDALSQQEIMDIERFSRDPTNHARIMDEIQHGQPRVRQLIIAQIAASGNSVNIIKHELGSKMIRALIQYGSEEQQLAVCSELLGHVHELSMHPYGRYCVEFAILHDPRSEARFELTNELLASKQEALALCKHPIATNVMQSIFEMGTSAERSAFANILKGHVMELSTDRLGSFVVQMAVQTLNTSDLSELAIELLMTDQKVLACATDQYGMFVIKLLIEHGTRTEELLIYSGLTSDPVAVATSKLGGIVLQIALNKMNATGLVLERKALVERLLVADSIVSVTCDKQGAYVIQHLLETGSEQDCNTLMAAMEGHLPEIAKSQSGCFVLEAVVDILDVKTRFTFFNELFEDHSEICELAFHPYGNFLVKKMLETGSRKYQLRIVKALSGRWAELAGTTDNMVLTTVLKVTHDNGTSLRDLVVADLLDSEGGIAALAKTTTGRIVLSNMILRGSPSARQMIFSGMQGHVADMSIDANGNQVIQTAFGIASPRYLTEMVQELFVSGGEPVVRCATSQHGSFVINYLVKNCSTEIRDNIGAAIKGHVTALATSEHARFLVKSMIMTRSMRAGILAELLASPLNILHCVMNEFACQVIVLALNRGSGEAASISQQRQRAIANALKGRALELATAPHAHCVILHAIRTADHKSREILVNEILSSPEDLMHLATNEFGVNLLRHLLACGDVTERSIICQALEGNAVYLATHEFGHVALIEVFTGKPGDVFNRTLVNEILASPESVIRCAKSVYGKQVVARLRDSGSKAERQQVEDALEIVRSMQGIQ